MGGNANFLLAFFLLGLNALAVSINYSQDPISRFASIKNKSLRVSFQPQVGTLTYEQYFGLNEKPFSLVSDSRFVYHSPSYVATYDSLLAGVRRREGLLVLTGEIGTGKTTLCRAVLRNLGRKTYSSLVPDPFASREDLLKMLLIDFGVLSIQELTTGPLRQASRTELGYLLSEFLGSLASDDFAVVIIDEAQNLSLPLIEETRILSDAFGAAGRLQIIFVGQPELRAKLKLPEMRQVDQRVCGYHRLAPLNRDAAAGYIQHRMLVAGARHDRELFPPQVIDVLHQRSGGVPRLINRVCDRALQLAYERQAAAVDREILDTALIEVGSATLSPTWDAIFFSEAATNQPAAAAQASSVPAAISAPAPTSAPVATPVPAATATPAATPVPAAPPTDAVEIASRINKHFKTEVDHWVEKDLAPQIRTLTSAHGVFAAEPSDPEPSQPQPAPRREARAAAQSRHVTTDWPKHVRSETYMQKLLRTWLKRTAIAAAVFVLVNAGVVGASVLSATLAPPVLPSLPSAPAFALAGLALPEAPPSDTRVSVSAPSGNEYLVSVGLFASRGRADQLVDALTQAGLPAMQRAVQLRGQEVQQIALGPYLSRSDAVADLRRLLDLGGYDDAQVVDSSQ